MTLKSLLFSPSSEYELDTDELDDSSYSHLHSQRQHGDDSQSMPLLVGLVDSAHARAGLDGHSAAGLALRQNEESEQEDIDLEELAAKRHAGGGLLDSVANMANSILGAGWSI